MDSLFGFCGCSGFCGVRFLPHVRVAGCSVCSVDFVEKMWRSLGKTLWKLCGKSFIKLWKSEFYTIRWIIFHETKWLCGKFYHWFYTSFYLCKIATFTHFPQRLLLRLLII